MGNQFKKKNDNPLGIFKHKQVDVQEQLHIKYDVSGLVELMPFVGAHAYKNIASLSLQGCAIGAAGCRLIIQAQWKNLRNINLRSNRIGNEGCAILPKSRWKDLRCINLIGNGLTDECCAMLIKGNWFNLKSMEFNEHNGKEKRRNVISKSGVDKLKLGVFKNDPEFKSSSTFYIYFEEPQIEDDFF